MQTSSFNVKLPICKVNINTLQIGGDSSFHFLTENGNTTKPLFALELNIFNPNEGSLTVQKAFNNVLNNPIELVKTAQETPCDILGLKFNINEDINNVEKAKELLTSLLPHIKKPLMIRGINNVDIDTVLLPNLISILDREAIIAFVDEKSYKSIVPSVIAGNHKLVIRTPIDINLAKEMNILTTEMGLNHNNILIDTDMGGLGYGLEYGYSIMERIKLAAFEGDRMLNMPIIAFAGEETLKTKEAKSDSLSKCWGELDNRAIMLEITAASAIAAAGANIIVVNHPTTVTTLKGLA